VLRYPPIGSQFCRQIQYKRLSYASKNLAYNHICKAVVGETAHPKSYNCESSAYHNSCLNAPLFKYVVRWKIDYKVNDHINHGAKVNSESAYVIGLSVNIDMNFLLMYSIPFTYSIETAIGDKVIQAAALHMFGIK
jgi:hypothetical protein